MTQTSMESGGVAGDGLRRPTGGVRRVPVAKWAVRAGVTLIYLFMLSPLIFVVWLSFFKDAIITFPPSGYTVSWYLNAWRNAAFADGFLLSLQLAACAAIGGVILGVAASLALARYRFPGRRTLGNVLLLPLVVPGIVAGIATYLFYLRAENTLDMDIVGTFGGLVIAHVCLTIPWTMRLVGASLAQIDGTIEEAARNLGAGPWRTLWRVTLPMLRPAVVAAGCSASSCRSRTSNSHCRWWDRARPPCPSRSCSTSNSTSIRRLPPSPRRRSSCSASSC